MKNYQFAEVTATNGKIYRTEMINLKDNSIFKNVTNIEDIRNAYESFWNNEIKVENIRLFPKYVKIEVCFSVNDETGKIEFDFEEMANQFENEISRLAHNVVVMCDIEENQITNN
jgi:hypothetical protein